MNTSVAFAVFCFVFSSCTQHSEDVQLPNLPLNTKVSPRPRSHGYAIVVNIDNHGKRVVDEQGYDAGDALSQKLVQCLARWPHAAVVIRADRHAPHESVMAVILIARQVGFASVSLAARHEEAPLIEEYLQLSYE